MASIDQKPITRGLQRDVLSTERHASITCPNCLGTLQVKAHLPAAAPCPICEHPLRYDPASAASKTPAFIPKETITPGSPRSVGPTPDPPKPSFRDRLGTFNEGLNSSLGIAFCWFLVVVLLTASVVLFIKRDNRRPQQSLRPASIESEAPPARPPSKHSSVPLLPGEPEPVDPLKLPE